MRTLTVIVLALACAPACLEAPEPSRMDSALALDVAPPLARIRLEIRDRFGRVYPEDAPTWPRLRLVSNVPFVDTSAVVLTRGLTYEELEDDLRDAPLRAATRARAVEISVSVDGEGLLAEPQRHLLRGERYLLGVAPWAFSDIDGVEILPFVAEIVVDTDPAAGAWASASWPADATFGVPTGLPFVAVRFDGELEIDSRVSSLEGPEGQVRAEVEAAPCIAIGWADGTCAVLRPDAPLAGGATYRLSTAPGLTDWTGAPVGPFSAEFVTSTRDSEPTTFVPIACTRDETAAGPVCVFTDDRRIALRVMASGPARFLASGGGHRARAVAPRGDALLVLEGFRPNEEVALSLSFVDLGGHEVRRVFFVTTTPPLAQVGITEVRADPLGPEPAQEYVELLNSGPMPIDLAGFSLADREDREGDIVERSVIIPAGGRVLLVGDSFDPRHPADASVPDGVPLGRIGVSLGSGGLSNAGEPLFLRDEMGRRISAAPAIAASRGQCVSRSSSDLRRGDADAFVVRDCSPGRPP